MDRNAWILTFVPRKNDPIPMPHRVRALLKYARRYCGLRCTADIPLRRQVIEECAAILCVDCAAGERVKCDEKGIW